MVTTVTILFIATNATIIVTGKEKIMIKTDNKNVKVMRKLEEIDKLCDIFHLDFDNSHPNHYKIMVGELVLGEFTTYNDVISALHILYFFTYGNEWKRG